MRQPGIVLQVGGSDIGFAERPGIRSGENTLQPLDLPDYLFQVHPDQYSEPPCKNPSLNQVQT